MLACESCGSQNPDGFRLCGFCGTPLADVGAASESRRVVTILFADVTGSTSLGEQMDPEALRDVMGRFFASMREVIERHGGTVEKFIGDAVMAVFGAPVVHEDDALRAVRAATEMRVALDALNQRLRADRGVALEIRTGLNTGPVVTGAPRAGGSFVVGDAVNVAARLQSAAAPGEILIGSSTYELVRDAVQATAVGPLVLKGKAEAVPAHRIDSVRAGAEGRRHRLDAPMIGRERELLALEQAFERAVGDRTCQLFTILGAAGVGKSRLVAEFLGRIRDRATVLRGRCLSYGDGITYWPIAEILRGAAGVEEGATAANARGAIEALVGDGADSPAVRRGLVQVAGLSDEGASREDLAWAVRRALEGLSDERPLVVLIDDIHWAEPTLLDLIESIVDLSRDSPMLVICPARPEFLVDRPAWGGGKMNATATLLEPLTTDGALGLIDALVDGADLPVTVRRRIVDAAEGNPLYVEEFLSMLVDAGDLAPGVDGWRIVRAVEDVSLPPSIQALIAARLDRLAPGELDAAKRASVVGRVFDQASVVALSPDGRRSDIPDDLLGLVRRELIRPDRSRIVGGESYRFRHLLVRDVAYEALPKADRAELHGRFAEWLENASGDRLPEVEEIVGYHLEQAFRYREQLGPVDDAARLVARRAAERLVGAGRRAATRGDVTAAVGLERRGLALLPDADPWRVAALPRLGQLLASNGRAEEARATLDEAERRAAALGDDVTATSARVVRMLVQRAIAAPDAEHDEVHRAADGAILVFERAGDQLGLALAWELHAMAYWREGRVSLEEPARERALAYARAAGDRNEEVEALTGVGRAIVQGPTPVPEGIARAETLIAASAGDRRIESSMSHALGHLYAQAGRFTEARAMAARSMAILEDGGGAVDAAVMTEACADVEHWAGETEAEVNWYRSGLERMRGLGATDAMHAAFLANSLCEAGDYDEAAELATHAIPAGGWVAANAKRALGLARAHGGDLEGGEALLRESLAIFDGTDFLNLRASASLALAEVLRLGGRAAEARNAAATAVELYRLKGNAVGLARAEAALD